MGGSVQKVLQRRRGKKKGIGQYLSLFLIGVLQSSTLLLLLLGIDSTNTYLFFSLLVLTCLILSYLYFSRRLSEYTIGIYTGQILVEGVFQIWGNPLLHLFHFPLILLPMPLLQGKSFVMLMILQPLLHLNKLIPFRDPSPAVFLVLLYITTVTCYLYFYTAKKRASSYATSYEKLKKQADEVLQERLCEEDILSRYVQFTSELEDEIRHLLKTLETSTVADCTSFFSFFQEEITSTVTTAPENKEATLTGLIKEASRSRSAQLIFLDRKEVEPGFQPIEAVQSLILCPVRDGDVCFGVVVVESCRFRAFDTRDVSLTESISEEIARIIIRYRHLARISFHQKGLQILHEESNQLLQALELQDVIRKISISAERLSGGRAVVILKENGHYRIVSQHQKTVIKKLTIKETVLDIVKTNRQPLYLEDISRFRKSPLPIPLNNVRSLMCFPVFVESTIKGYIVVYSDKASAFNSMQLSLLEVFINQASESLSRALLHEQIRLQAITDALTGLFNRRHFQQRLNENLKRAERFKENVSLLLIDIDHFKKVNDTYGHPAGDMVLKKVAGLITTTIRDDIDIAARFGGEEFAVLVIGATSRQARKTAERLRKRIKAESFQYQDRVFRITISVGIASFPDDSNTPEQLIQRADEALYSAKENGRDRVVLFADIAGKGLFPPQP